MSAQTQDLSAQGSRRLTLTMMSVRDQADRFEGVARGSAKPLWFLAAFQEAEPYLGLPPQAFKLIAWLVKMTQAIGSAASNWLTIVLRLLQRVEHEAGGAVRKARQPTSRRAKVSMTKAT